MQHGARRHRRLATAGGAFEGVRLGLPRPRPRATTAWTDEAGGPAGREQPARASLLAAEPSLEIDQRTRELLHRGHPLCVQNTNIVAACRAHVINMSRSRSHVHKELQPTQSLLNPCYLEVFFFLQHSC